MMIRTLLPTLVAALLLGGTAGEASAYVDGGPIAGTPVTVADGPPVETDPQVSGSLVSYTVADADLSIRIHYRDLASGATGIVPGQTGAFDLLSDVSGSLIAFTRVDSLEASNINVYDVATGATRALAFSSVGEAANPAIGGDTVVWEDTSSGQRELRVHDLAAGTTSSLAAGGNVFTGAVSPAGDVVVWTALAGAGAEVWEARRVAGSWVARRVAAVDGPYWGVSTDGAVVAYVRGGEIRWQPVGGGVESTVALPGTDQGPSVSGGAIVFEHSDGAQSDILLYDTATDILRSVTSTPARSETLSDVSARPDGSLLIAWAGPNSAGNFDIQALVTPPKDPVARIADLIDHTLVAVDLPTLTPLLKSRLQAALRALVVGNRPLACSSLAAYRLAVAFAPATVLTPAEKTALTAEAKAIERQLGCP